jgi:hypothetical protein
MWNQALNKKVHLPQVKILKSHRHVSLKQLLVFVIIFAGLGGYIIWQSFAAQPVVASLESEQMTLPSGASTISDTSASGGQAIRFRANGTATGTVNIASGSSATSLSIKAHGNSCRGWASMNVGVDGNTIIPTTAMSTTGWNTYSVNVNLASGSHTVSISASNVASRKNCVRSLYADVTTFYGPAPVVATAPTVALAVSPASVTAGQASTLTWSSTDASSCTANGGWSGSEPTSGSVSTGALNITTTYSLSCTGTGGTATASATVTVSSVPTTTPGSYGGAPIVSQLFWNGDFSTGDWGQYDDCRSLHMDGVWPTYYTIVKSVDSLALGPIGCSSTKSNPTPPNVEVGPVLPGFKYAGKYTVGPGSVVSGEAAQRTLDTLWPNGSPSTAKTKAYQGMNVWYRDAVYFPSNFVPIANNDFNWTYEIHNWPDGYGDAMLSCGVDTTTSVGVSPTSDGVGTGTRFSCRMLGGGSPSNPIDARNSAGSKLYTSANWATNPDVKYTYVAGIKALGLAQWYDMTFHIKWSWQQDGKNACTDSTSVSGCFEWWINGTKVTSWSGPTLLYYGDNNSDDTVITAGPGQGYMDHGYYRSGSGTNTTSVYHAATVIGPTAASIGEPY